MASPGHRRKRRSIEEPPYIAEVLYLKDELNRLHDDTSSECHERIKKMTDLVNDFEKDYKRATRAIIGGGIAAGIVLFVGLSLAIFSGGTSAVVGGIGASAAAAGGIAVALRHFKRQQKEKNTRKVFEDHLTELQNKISPVIDVLQKLLNKTQKILRDPSISEHKANMIRERLFYCFDQMQFFQIDDNREATASMSETVHFTEQVSEVFAKMNSLLEILNEIIEDDEEKNEDTDNRPKEEKPAETTTRKKVDDKQFKKKSETFINEMRKGINLLQNTINEIDQIKIRVSKRFE